MIDMRNIALTFLGCFTILAACSNSDDAEKQDLWLYIK